MSLLEIKNLTQIFDNKILFEDASLEVNKGEHTGIVGLNGAGKSTFMNIICGKLIQDEGEVMWQNGIKWGYLDQHSDIDRSLTIMQYLQTSFQDLFDMNTRMESMYEDMETETDPDKLERLITVSSAIMNDLLKGNFYDLDSQIKKVANGLGINNLGYDTKISQLSGGQRTKIMLANLLLTDYDIILLDEPTNYLDFEHIAWLTDYLNGYKGTVLVISHDTEFLDKVCRNIISVEDRKIRKYSGSYKQFLTASTIAAKQRAESFENQQQQIKKMEEFIAKNKARAATAGMANARKKQLEKMEIIDKPITIYPSTFNFPYSLLHTKDMLIVKNLEIGYDEVLLPPINLHLSSESKIWIRGTNGIGKSTLLKTLTGKIPPLHGTFQFSLSAIKLYLEQDLEFNNDNETAVSYLSSFYPQMNSKEIRTRLGNVGIKNDLAIKSIQNLSGGEQVKVKLCVLMQNQTNILLLDEPTNHLDINAKESLTKALKNYKGAIILVTHEKMFAEAVCNEVFDL
ncbi:MAG TPA: ABC-F family ATP-binding cassette domain-containing protein [Clostridia bacterium]|nr:ABC-F family ATP-binding cassette domain-containing protein [Clostridia bacterium]